MKPAASKKEILLDYLGRGIAMIHLDARRPGVVVPAQHAIDPHLRINLSYRYGIPDLVIDDRRVQATLSFGGRPFQCQMPWSAIFGITSQHSGDGQIWPEDLPTEAMAPIAAAADKKGKAPAAPKRKRPALVAVEDDSEDAPESEEKPAEKTDPEPDPEPGSPGAGKRGGHLRIVR